MKFLISDGMKLEDLQNRRRTESPKIHANEKKKEIVFKLFSSERFCSDVLENIIQTSLKCGSLVLQVFSDSIFVILRKVVKVVDQLSLVLVT